MRLLSNCVALAPLFAILSLAGCASPKIELAARHDLVLAEANAQLDQLPVPSGMSAAEFDALRQALGAQLAASGADRWVSAAPADTQNQVSDLYLTKINDFSAQAHWSYRNVGDYDQNSEVNISDLTPLGINLAKNSTSPDWTTAQLADGDGNSEVNISDITPLGAHLQNSVDGYMIQTTTTPLVESSWQPAGIAQFGDSTQASAGAKRTFSATVMAVSGQSFRVVPFFAAANGIPGLPFAYTGQTGGPPLSFEEREIVLNLIAAKFANLTATTSSGQDAELADYIATLPHIESAGFVEGNAWGIFDDGRPLLVVKNRKPNNPRPVAQASALSWPRQPSHTGVPVGTGGNLLWSFGEGDFRTDPTDLLVSILAEKEYDPYRGATTILALKNVTGYGLLYIDAQGGYMGDERYWLGTVERWNRANDTLYEDDLNQTRLAYMLAQDASGHDNWTYAFGSEFVLEYMSFSENSFVFVNACNSATNERPGDSMYGDLAGAFIGTGATVYLGWTANVSDSVMFYGALHVYDRLLGTNQLSLAKDPPIRPFRLQDVLFDMYEHGISSAQPVQYPDDPPQAYTALVPIDELFQVANNHFYQLTPTIEHMEVRMADNMKDNELVLTGSFGQFEDYVWIGPPTGLQLSLPLIEWTPEEIRCELPDQGVGACGEVYVEVRGHESNRRQLTEWSGTLTYSEVGPGTLTHTLHYDIHLRADINSYRILPDTDPLASGPYGDGFVSIFSAPDDYATVSSSGSYTDPSNTVTIWTDAGTTRVPNIYVGSIGNYMNYGGIIDLKTGKITFAMPSTSPFHEKKVNDVGTVIRDVDTSFQCEPTAAALPATATMQLDAGSAIQAGSYQKQAGVDIVWTLSWNPFPASYPPDPVAPR